MSSRCEVLIRNLALLQRKTLIETRNRTLKWHYLTVRSMKNVAVLIEKGAFALFLRPHPGGFDSSRVPTPGYLPSKAKKNANARGSVRGGGGGRLGAGGIDWCITSKMSKIARTNSEATSGHSDATLKHPSALQILYTGPAQGEGLGGQSLPPPFNWRGGAAPSPLHLEKCSAGPVTSRSAEVKRFKAFPWYLQKTNDQSLTFLLWSKRIEPKS